MLACAVDDQACNHRVLFRNPANAVKERCFCSSRSISTFVRVIRTVPPCRVCTARYVTSLPAFAVIVLRVFSHPADGRMHSAIIYIHMRVRNAELGAKLRVASHEKLPTSSSRIIGFFQSGTMEDEYDQNSYRGCIGVRVLFRSARTCAEFIESGELGQPRERQPSSTRRVW
jgi:hypothetical protein